MRYALAAFAMLFSAPALGVPPVPISFTAEVDADSFRITNTSPTATILRVTISPKSVDIGGFVESHPNDMDVARMTSRPNEDFHWWAVAGGWNEDRWTEWQWTQAPAMLSVRFAQFWPTGSEFGTITAPLETGRFEGFTLPEPSALALGFAALACLVWAKRRAASANNRTGTPPT